MTRLIQENSIFNKNRQARIISDRLLLVILFQCRHFISYAPGDCNDTVPCGSQPIIEIQDTATHTLVGNLGWRGRVWKMNAYMKQGAGNVILGTTSFQIPRSGRAEYKNICFYDIAFGYKLKFAINVTPHSENYSGMAVISNAFNVNPRQFYLEVVTQAANANQSVAFGTQPVVEVRDVGTRRVATPLKTQSWFIAVSLSWNPKPGKSFLNGTFNVSVVNETTAFQDLFITAYGEGYKLKFESNYGHSVLSAPFEVGYSYKQFFDNLCVIWKCF